MGWTVLLFFFSWIFFMCCFKWKFILNSLLQMLQENIFGLFSVRLQSIISSLSEIESFLISRLLSGVLNSAQCRTILIWQFVCKHRAKRRGSSQPFDWMFGKAVYLIHVLLTNQVVLIQAARLSRTPAGRGSSCKARRGSCLRDRSRSRRGPETGSLVPSVSFWISFILS